MSYRNKMSVPNPTGNASPAHLNTELIKEIDSLREENAFLQFALDKADDALGPASDDIWHAIKEQYVATGKKVPAGYQ